MQNLDAKFRLKRARARDSGGARDSILSPSPDYYRHFGNTYIHITITNTITNTIT